MQDIANSILLIYKEGNYLAKWPLANGNYFNAYVTDIKLNFNEL